MRFFLLSLFIASCSGNLLGKFILHIKQHVSGDQLEILNRPDNVKFAQTSTPIPSEQVSDMLSLAIGVSAGDITWPGLMAGSFFNKPKALVVFATEDLSDKPIKDSFPIKLSEKALTMEQILQVNGEHLEEHIARPFDHKSLTLSLSSEKLPSKDEIIKKITTIMPQKGFTYNKKDAKVTETSSDTSFDLDNENDLKIFAELVNIQSKVDELASQLDKMEDTARDAFIFHISSPKIMKKLHGADSKKLKAATVFIEAFIARVSKQLSKYYSGNALVVHIRLVAHNLKPHQSTLEKVHAALSKEMKTVIAGVEHLFPEVHVKQMEQDAKMKLCQTLKDSLKGLSNMLSFVCHTSHSIQRRSLLSNASPLKTEFKRSTIYDPMFPVIFNIWLWLVIVLALAIYAISVAMWNMDPGDSIIYRLTQQKIKAD